MTHPLTARLMAVIMGMLVPAGLWAHGNVAQEVGTRVDAALSATWRDEGVFTEAGIWQLPGVLMGGEAYPVEAGMSVDDARVTLTHRTDHDVFALLQVSSHAGAAEAELHHALVGVDGRWDSVGWQLAAGRMASKITPANEAHASDRWFSETPLALDAFLGRQLNDEGVRAVVSLGAWQFGLEQWRGNAFPATPDEQGGSVDAYVQVRHDVGATTWLAGIAWLQADANGRSDSRYSTGAHQHGGATVVAPEYGFDGSTELGGAFVRGEWRADPVWGLSWEAQWLKVRAEGELRDSTRTAQLVGEYNGGWLQAVVNRGPHYVGARWEQLALDNHLSGAAAAPLSALAGLDSAGHDPERTTALYYWQAKPSLALRLEATADQLQVHRIERFAVGVVWRESLLERK